MVGIPERTLFAIVTEADHHRGASVLGGVARRYGFAYSVRNYPRMTIEAIKWSFSPFECQEH